MERNLIKRKDNDDDDDKRKGDVDKGKMMIKGSVWFTSINGPIIGIILVDTGYEEKAYIGTGLGIDEKLDEIGISKYGAKFPLKQAKQIIGK